MRAFLLSFVLLFSAQTSIAGDLDKIIKNLRDLSQENIQRQVGSFPVRLISI
jgi:hypothetical protein